MNYVESLRRRLLTAKHSLLKAQDEGSEAERNGADLGEAMSLMTEDVCEVMQIGTEIERAEALGEPCPNELAMDPPVIEFDRSALSERMHRLHPQPEKLLAAVGDGRAQVEIKILFPANVALVSVKSDDPSIPGGRLATWDSKHLWTTYQTEKRSG